MLETFEDLEIKLNCEVGKVQRWLLANRLSVHYNDKTQYMLIYRPGYNEENENYENSQFINNIEFKNFNIINVKTYK